MRTSKSHHTPECDKKLPQMPSKSAFTLVLMGPSGCGKSTIGKRVAGDTGSTFIDADDFHPVANRQKMQRGEPLTDADRFEWLERLRDEIRRHNNRNETVILACSALKEGYRNVLREAGPQVAFVYLKGDRKTLLSRLQARPDHFFPPELLDSQLAILEEPTDAFTLRITSTPDCLADQISARFFDRPPRS